MHVLPVQEHQISLEGSAVYVSLQPGHLPNKCIASFAVGPPVLVDFSSNTAKPLPALVMGESRFDLISCICNAQSCSRSDRCMFVMLAYWACHLLF